MMASPAPSANEPTSPMKTLAGFQLNTKKPRSPPTTQKQNVAIER